MKQIIQNLKTGETSLLDVACPEVSRGCVLIETRTSLISPGTERMLIDFGKANYLAKAKQQPDKVREVLTKVRTDGLAATYDAVQSKLSQPIPLGYCNVGEVIATGDDVTEFSVGDRVVSNGNHAEVVSVPRNLCARIPDNVSDEDASFAVLGAIGLQGVRLANVTLGEAFVVIGLGVIGLMTVQILRAHGCRVLAIDMQAERLALAKSFGAMVVNPALGDDIQSSASLFSRNRGVDGVIITASTESNDVISQAAKMCRKRGRIILVGVTGLDLVRDDFYEKELIFQVSCSYGPGRYDTNYEELGNDYPLPFVRWTEQRNFEAILDLMAAGLLSTQALISHRCAFKDAPQLYTKLSKRESGLGMILQYNAAPADVRSNTIPLSGNGSLSVQGARKEVVVSVIGAGNYASRFLIPAFTKAGVRLHSLATSQGLSGSIHGSKAGFEYSSTDLERVLNNDESDVIVVATRHDSHADLVCRALEAGKSVFVEKPLAMDREGLDAIVNAYSNANANLGRSLRPQVMVGFNRRYSPHVRKMKMLLGKVKGPKSFIMTMNAGSVPSSHWVNDPMLGGGRIVGEACHYIDLMRFLVGEPIVDVQARGIRPHDSSQALTDCAVITLGFADGSFGSVNYFSNGSSGYPKEKIEVFCSGRTLVLDNFKVLKGYGWKHFSKFRTWRQNKGQQECVEEFLSQHRGNEQAIPFEELIEVADASLSAAEKLRA